MESVFESAYAAHQAGRLDEAEQGYRAALEMRPTHIDALNLLGVLRHQQGQPAEAAELLRQAIKLQPGAATLHLNLGTMLRALDRPYEALDSFRDSLTLAPGFAPAHFNLGNTLLALGRHEEARAALTRAQGLAPDDPGIASNLGNALAALGQHEAACAAFRRALELKPGHPGALNNLGLSQLALGQTGEALAQFEAAVAVEPRFPAALFHLGNTLCTLERPAEAVPRFEAALALQADFVPARLGLADTLAALNRHHEARSHYERVLGLDPGCAAAWLALGTTHLALGDPERALRAFDETLRREPGNAPAQVQRATALLALGDFARGLPAYEVRHSLPGAQHWSLPQWFGEPMASRTLFVPADTGLDDTLRLLRFVPLARQRCARLIVQVPAPLQSLVDTVAGRWDVSVIASHTLPSSTAPDGADLVCPLSSLPLALQITRADLGAAVPYLRAPSPAAGAVRTVEVRMSAAVPRRKFGIAWSGGRPADDARAIPLALLEPLFVLPDIEWFVLEPQPTRAERARLVDRARFATQGWVYVPPEPSSAPADVAAMAASIAQLDGVVSIDTTAAHLAGALGKPLWLMLPQAADGHWFGGETSPWYPGSRVVRQTEAGRWNAVIARVAASLARR